MDEEGVSDAAAGTRMGTLLHLATTVASAGQGGVLLRTVAEEARRALSARSLSLSEWQRERGVLRTLVNVGELAPWERTEPDDEVYPLSEHGRIHQMLLDGGAFIASLEDADVDPAVAAFLRSQGMRSVLVAPITVEGRSWGELWAARAADDPPYTAGDLDFATLVAVHVGAGAAHVEHVRRIERLAYTDELTGLANRRAFEDALDHALDRLGEDGTSVGVIVVDVNGLKKLNDSRGHAAGDAALVAFAAELAALTRDGVLTARLGGDEFCLLVSGGSSDDVVALAEEVCRRGERVLEEGVACGVAATQDLPDIQVTPSRLMRAADAAQYRAKRVSGRQPVVAGRTAEGVPVEPVRPERRLFRGRALVDVGQLLDRVAAAVDARPHDDRLARLSAVAATVAEAIDASSWFVSSIEPGSDLVVTRDGGVLRRDPGTGEGYYDPETYPLADYPATYAAVTGSAVVVDVDDPRADPAETALLVLAGLSEMVMSGGADPDGRRWLVEVLADELSSPVRPYASVLRAGAALALRP
jgi:diguanylate cyclase (GGDEF)-like protein